ncbi:threonine-phosphate decarboxylase [Clostridium bornimense]|uniref:threonine-phosphate decarboxylase n=1 Tax=Clostridium bornimense TaxID=1216932 RepID=W6RXF8_9CLOT|nr:threonine-phosphate decarboxylase CobD [Clostridium bornimense]CDM68319.1 threonine-phosphate decarboxylase [Clostridium bornimense]
MYLGMHGGDVEEVARRYNIDKKNIIDFSANINPLGISEKCKEAMIDSLNNINVYPDITYFRLKKSISRFENINSNNIFLGNGAAECIFNVVRAINPKKALIPAPSFSEYKQAVDSVDGEIKYHVLKENNNFNFDEDFICDITEDVDLVFICNPNNPTGTLTSREFILKVIEKAKIVDAIIVIDESFLDFVFEEERYTLKNLINSFDRLVIIKSLTKFFALPGVRVGYGITSNTKIMKAIKKISIPWNINTVAVEGSIASLNDTEYIKKTREYMEKERENLYKEIKSHKGIKVFNPSVNYIFFKLESNIDLRGKLLEKNILIRSCENYYGLDNRYYRVAVKSNSDNKILVKLLEEVLNE